MPIHDWTRVDAGIFHAFHLKWLAAIADALNAGTLPPDYYALPEQVTAGYGADVLTLRRPVPAAGGGATAPASARFRDERAGGRRRRRNRIAVRHVSGDDTVAVIEVASPGNKDSRRAFRAFVGKACGLVEQGVHLLVVDLFPPTPRDPRGLHAAVWRELARRRFDPPEGEPLTLASYQAGEVVRCYVEPTAVGRPLVDMPLFLAADVHVSVPLEASYQSAWVLFPARWRSVLDGPPPAA